MKSILSDVVGKYSRHTENICSESLALVINESELLKASFRDLVLNRSRGHVKLESRYSFLTQVGSKSDKAIPDLQIEDHSGHIYLIEAKFTARVKCSKSFELI